MTHTGWRLEDRQNVIGRCGTGVRGGHFHRLAGLRSKMTPDSFVDIFFHEVVDVSPHVAADVVTDEGVDVFGNARAHVSGLLALI